MELKDFVSRNELLSLLSGGAKIRKLFWEGVRGDKKHLRRVITKLLHRLEEPAGKPWEVEVCTLLDTDYPKQLLHLDEPPIALFLQGNRQLLELSYERLISIIGSRHATDEAIRITSRWATACTDVGLIVVSGLALGIDGAAHRGALSENRMQSTIAVLGNGLDEFYPSSHRSLHEQIVEQGGLLITEYPPGIGSHKHHFLERNRIIAALSKLTLVTQAKVRSGALVTARLANEIGREVAAVPWSVSVVPGKGSNLLIQQGGHCVTSEQDIFNLLNIKEAQKEEHQHFLKDQNLSQNQREALTLLNNQGKVSVDELKGKTAINPAEFCDLELKDIIHVDHFGFVCLS